MSAAEQICCPECGAPERPVSRGRRVEYRHLNPSPDACVIDLAERKLYGEADTLRTLRRVVRELSR